MQPRTSGFIDLNLFFALLARSGNERCGSKLIAVGGGVSNPLRGANFDMWYHLWIICALLVLMASIVSGQNLWALGALGGLLFGIGELRNHPKRTTVVHDWKIEDRRRSPSFFGVLLNIIGVILMLGALVLASEIA